MTSQKNTWSQNRHKVNGHITDKTHLIMIFKIKNIQIK